MSPSLLWLIAGVLLCIMEIFTLGFFALWFGAGAFAAAVLAATGLGLAWQLVAFTIVSLILLFSSRKFFLKATSENEIKTNVDALIGEEGIVLRKVQKEFMEQGQVKVRGEVWTAVCEQGSIDPGEIVEVVRVSGAKLIVKRKESPGVPGGSGIAIGS